MTDPGPPGDLGGEVPTAAAGAQASGLPEAAARRLGSGAWSSGLSVPDFASCVSMGLEPVGFVQGYAVMQWSWYNRTYSGNFYGSAGGPPGPDGRGQYNETWRCPHGFVGTEHRMYGVNYEQTWVEASWAEGFGFAYDRMVAEAAALGAHGVIGVVNDMAPLAGSNVVEFKIQGTAVVVPGATPPPTPFTTYLSGQRLGKLIEAGFVPVAVVAALSSVQMFGYCITHYQLSGSSAGGWSGAVSGVQPVAQVVKAQRAARHLAREHVRAQLGHDILHGASMVESEREIGEGDLAIECLVRGSRVRRFKDFDPLPEPGPVVRLT